MCRAEILITVTIEKQNEPVQSLGAIAINKGKNDLNTVIQKKNIGVIKAVR